MGKGKRKERHNKTYLAHTNLRDTSKKPNSFLAY